MAYFNDSTGVFIYALSTCVHCKHTKAFLEDQGGEFNFVDVDLLTGDDQSEALKEMSKYNPSQSFPTLVIGKQVIVGFREHDIREAVAKLKGAK